MAGKSPENKEAPNFSEKRPQGKSDVIRALGKTALGGKR